MSAEQEKEWRQETAALYALGALSQHEARAFEVRLAEDAACAGEAQAFTEVIAALALAAPEQTPPAALRTKLLARVAAEAAPIAHAATVAPKFLETRYDAIEWQELAPGLFAKELFRDTTAQTISTLYKMLPGTIVASHTHPGVEQCFILSGDFVVNGAALGPGDFHCAMPGSVHETITTERGTVLLVVAPYDYTVAG